MNCKKTLKLLSEHVDGRLSGRTTWEVDRHLTECNRCTEVANELRKTVAVAQSIRRFEAPPNFAARLQERLATCPSPPKRQPWVEAIRVAVRPRVLPAWGTAAVALVLMLAVTHRTHVDPPRPAVSVGEPVALHPAGFEHIALTASGPLDDVSASVLESHYAQDYDSVHPQDAETQD